MEHSSELSKLASALAKFQSVLKPIPCNAVGDDGTPFADYTAIREATRKPLAKFGLSVVQFAGADSVTTVLVHESGEFMSGTTSTATDDRYGRRHALMCSLGAVQAEPMKPIPLQVEKIHATKEGVVLVEGKPEWCGCIESCQAILDIVASKRPSMAQVRVALRKSATAGEFAAAIGGLA